MHIERLGRTLGLAATLRLHLFQRHALVFPELGAFAPFAIGEADHRHIVALGSMKRDRATAAPYKIRRMRADDQSCLVCHNLPSLCSPRRSGRLLICRKPCISELQTEFRNAGSAISSGYCLLIPMREFECASLTISGFVVGSPINHAHNDL